MAASAWLLYLLIAVAIGVATILHYRLREPSGRGRMLLATLRALALALVVLLLFDPLVPAPAAPDGGGTVVLLDASLSMRLPDTTGTTRWEQALRIVEDVDPEQVMLFGAGTARVVQDLEVEVPAAPQSRLGEALRAALESGAQRVVVVTDAAIEDAPEVDRLLERAAGRVAVRVVGADGAANLALEEVEVPAWVEADEEVAVRVAVARLGRARDDSVSVVVRREGEELGRARVQVPPEGRLSTADIVIEPGAASADPVPLEVVLEGTDAEPDDDRRVRYIRIAEQPAGVALVSFAPDQEPRFLLPVLERALGVPARGWLALPGGRYIRLGTGTQAGTVDSEAAVREALDEASLKVVQGVGVQAPAWARAAAESGRVMVLPPATAPAPGPDLPPLQPGDWYVTSDIPPSPVAPLLSDIEVGDVPPLVALRPLGDTVAGWAPLRARLGRRGSPRPVLLAQDLGDRRIAVALGEGYWRWAFAGGAARDLYQRLWSSVAGWLLEDGEVVQGDPVRPVERVVARGQPIEWQAPAGTDSLQLVLQPMAVADSAAAAMDTAVAVSGGRATIPVLPPGRYRYSAVARDLDSTDAPPSVVGELVVESYSPEFARPRVGIGAVGGAVDGVADGAEGAGPGAAGSAGGESPVQEAGRPLHTTPWPYLLLVGLISAEWILRRRWGLR